MKLKFYGGRGSHAVSPTPSRVREIVKSVWDFAQERKIHDWSELERALATQPRSLHQIYGGNTTCLELKSNQQPMPCFFDAGTGLTAAGSDPSSGLNSAAFQNKRGEAAFFFSHTHWDHILGLITIEQLFAPGNQFHFYGVHKKLSERIATLFIEEHFPVPFRFFNDSFHFHQIPLNETTKFGDLRISHAPQTHPGGSFAYRVDDGNKVFVFATDTELKNINPPQMQPGSNIYSKADVLVLDAQFSPEEKVHKEGFGHADIASAVDLAVREGVKRLYLFHQNPYYGDATIDQQLSRAREHLKRQHGVTARLDIEMTIEEQEIDI